MDRCRNTSRNGSVLVILLFISGAVAILGTGMFAVGYQARARAERIVHEMAAGVAADAGLTQAVHTLLSQYADGSLDPHALPSQTNADLPNFDGTFTYTITENSSGGYTITSVGSYRAASKTVEGVVKPVGMVHEYALFVQEDVVLKNSAGIDWYQNESGDDPLKIGTNSTGAGEVKLYSGAFINGDVMVGAGGDPESVIVNSGGVYTGQAYAQSTSRSVRSVQVPDYLISSTGGGKITGNTTVAGSGKYDEIDLGNNGTLTIQGNVELYITGGVTLGKSAEIQIPEGASLVLYVDGEVEGKQSSRFNNQTGDPRSFRLMGTDSCTKVSLKNSGDMYGIVYAPQAELTLYNSATMWGSITSKTCELDNGALLYYDASLRDYHDPSLPELKLTSWREY